jgi:hypothetical protein
VSKFSKNKSTVKQSKKGGQRPTSVIGPSEYDETSQQTAKKIRHVFSSDFAD